MRTKGCLALLLVAAQSVAPLDVSRRQRAPRAAPLASRRHFFCGSAIAAAAVVAPADAANAASHTNSALRTARSTNTTVALPTTNVTEALTKNKVVVRRKDLLTEVVVDPTTGDELRELQLPAGYPKALRPPRIVERKVSQPELALAAVVAGGTTEIVRVAALHPLATLKLRAQARPGTGPFALIDADGNGVIEPNELRDLYAGLVPSVSAAARAGSASFVPSFCVDGVELTVPFTT